MFYVFLRSKFISVWIIFLKTFGPVVCNVYLETGSDLRHSVACLPGWPPAAVGLMWQCRHSSKKPWKPEYMSGSTTELVAPITLAAFLLTLNTTRKYLQLGTSSMIGHRDLWPSVAVVISTLYSNTRGVVKTVSLYTIAMLGSTGSRASSSRSASS